MQDETEPPNQKPTGLAEVIQDVAEGREPRRSVREILRWFGAHRRGSIVVDRIETELKAAGLRTDPDFTTTWIDADVTFKPLASGTTDNQAGSGPADGSGDPPKEEPGIEEIPKVDFLVRMLRAANLEVVSVNPQDSVEKAVTLMLAHDFSQLAVISKPRELNGTISWKSIGSRLSQRRPIAIVSDAMDPAPEVQESDSLFAVMPLIFQHDFAFVRAKDRTICGIVTSTDLSEQFHQLSEPFLLLARIENQLRQIIQRVFDLQTLRDAVDERDEKRKASITKASDLSFGEYRHIFQDEQNWQKLSFVACRKTFCDELDKVRDIRNETMHFRPDEADKEGLLRLRRFSRLLDKLEHLSK